MVAPFRLLLAVLERVFAGREVTGGFALLLLPQLFAQEFLQLPQALLPVATLPLAVRLEVLLHALQVAPLLLVPKEVAEPSVPPDKMGGSKSMRRNDLPKWARARAN